MTVTTRQVGFDARLAGHSHAGIGRYAEELLRHWVRLTNQSAARSASAAQLLSPDQRVQWHVFTRQAHDLPWLDDYQHVTRHVADVRHYTLAEQTRWWRMLQHTPLDWLHVPHFNVPLLYQGPYSVTIHDLLWHDKRDPRATTLSVWQHALKYGAYRIVSNQAMRRARMIFVPSQVVARQVHDHTRAQTPVIVTPEGVSDVYRHTALRTTVSPDSAPTREPYIVFTGSLYPHKNVAVILRALRLLPEWRLKIVGVRSVFHEQTAALAQRGGVAAQIDWLGYVPDQELIAIYHQAIAVLQPSTSEGFGLTGLEALATGATLVCSDLPVFREVYADHAYRFAPYDAVALAEILRHLHHDPPPVNERVSAQRYARQFTWSKMAEQSWQALQSAWTKPL